MELSPSQFQHLIQRFPPFELSYETISHKKVSTDYDVCLAIPIGKKAYMWFTFYHDQDVCILLDMNREKKIVKATVLKQPCPVGLETGTVVYGTVIQPVNVVVDDVRFVIEDIFYYCGIAINKSHFHEKLQFLLKAMPLLTKQQVEFRLPNMWEFEKLPDGTLPETLAKCQGLTSDSIHHIQYRSFHTIMPYLNIVINKKPYSTNNISEQKKDAMAHISLPKPPNNIDFSKPQYKYPTVFQVKADLQYDIYHLYAYGKNSQPTYYNVAYIPNYKTSVFMNGIFRNIRENKNLDYIEESDDENEFENCQEDRFVNLEKTVLMECVFNSKFKKWTPIREVSKNKGQFNNKKDDRRGKVIHVNALLRT